jgi:hypothetical protein
MLQHNILLQEAIQHRQPIAYLPVNIASVNLLHRLESSGLPNYVL